MNIRSDVKEFFYGSVWPSVICNLGTWFFIILSLFSEKMLIVACIVFIGAQIYKLIDRLLKSCPNWNNYVAEDIERHTARAVQKLGIDASQVSMIAPIRVYGPYQDFSRLVTTVQGRGIVAFLKALFRPLFMVTPFYGIKLIMDRNFYRPEFIMRYESEQVKYSMVTQHIFFFTEEQVLVYEVKYDLVNGLIYEENTYDYFYRDIDCIETGAKTEEVRYKKKTLYKPFEYFKVIVYSGTGTYAITDGQAGVLEYQVMAMRALVRERKLRP